MAQANSGDIPASTGNRGAFGCQKGELSLARFEQMTVLF